MASTEVPLHKYLSETQNYNPGQEPKNGKSKKEKKSKEEPEEEAHVLGAWLQDEHVLELLKLHSGVKKKDNIGNTHTKSQSEVTQTKAKGKGTSKTPGAGSEPNPDVGLHEPAVATPTASVTEDQMRTNLCHSWVFCIFMGT